MLKKFLVLVALSVPMTAIAAGKAKKEEPVVHLTDEQIYEQLKKFALVFDVARDSFVEEADEKKMLEAANQCEAIDQIDRITGEILKVASTTNILALNAHTEAARAGSFGRGFSIIADNISTLSDQISTLVKDIQNTNQSVKVTVEGLLAGLEGVSKFLDEDVQRDYEKFVSLGNDYSVKMSDMAELLYQFNQSAGDINENISRMRQRIAEMDSVVSGAADEISRVYGISVEVKKDTEKLEQVASDNRSEAEKMSGEVSRYQF